MRWIPRRLAQIAIAAALSCHAPLLAQHDSDANAERPCERRLAVSRTLETRATVDVRDVRLGDFVDWLAASVGIEFFVAWQNDSDLADGLDPDAAVSVTATEAPVRVILQRVLDGLDRQSFTGDAATWQLTEWGEVQIGPRSILNRTSRLEIYDVADLLLEIPDYLGAPDLDLNTALQSGQGGGGQSPFQDADEDPERIPFEDRANNLIDIIRSNVEPDQWRVVGGDAAQLRLYRKTLLIRAPDYIHRQIGGYRCRPN
ncbi:MAG: hypothetical protein AAGB51_07645 [Planctomycetota bacterium]